MVLSQFFKYFYFCFFFVLTGSRLGKLNIKIGIAIVLAEYNVRKGPNFNENVEFCPKSPILLPKGQLNLKLTKIY